MVSLEKIHSYSFENHDILMDVDKCGCFYCERIFKPSQIVDWIEDKNGLTSQCLYCEIDSVIPESKTGEYDLSRDLLKQMYEYWF